MWTGLSGGHVGLIARFGARFAVRTGGGLVFLILLVVVGMSVAALFILPVENLLKGPAAQEFARQRGRPLTTAEVIEESSKQSGVRDMVGWISHGDPAQVGYLLDANPSLLSAILLVLLMLIPYLAVFGGFNQTAGDIGNRGLRYLLLRTERVNIYFGRFLASVLHTTVYLAVLITLLLVYIGFKLQLYGSGALIAWGAQGYAALLLLALPYLALCAWISAAVGHAFGSLLLCLVVVGIPVALLALTSSAIGFDFDAYARVLPWGWKYDLLAGELGPRLAAIGMMLAFTTLFLLLGLRTLHKRDL